MLSLIAIKCPHCGDYLKIAVMGVRPSLLLRLAPGCAACG